MTLPGTPILTHQVCRENPEPALEMADSEYCHVSPQTVLGEMEARNIG